MKYFFKVLSKYFDFRGRARRKEYWYFVLFYCVFQIFADSLDYILFDYSYYLDPGAPLMFGFGNSFYLLLIIPSISVLWRRMHDVGKSGWYGLIPIYGWFILTLTNGDSGDNDYGSDPKI